MPNNLRDTTSGQFVPRPAIDRFNEKYEATEDGHWLWTSADNENGYGLFKVKGARGHVQTYAHRWSYEHHVGPIPEGMTIDHLCGKPRCVNPEHLEPVPLKENIHRGNPRWKQLAARDECQRGHPFDEENTYLLPDGGRRCRTCQREQVRRHRAARRERTRDRP